MMLRYLHYFKKKIRTGGKIKQLELQMQPSFIFGDFQQKFNGTNAISGKTTAQGFLRRMMGN
jgi:hypothetical protein